MSESTALAERTEVTQPESLAPDSPPAEVSPPEVTPPEEEEIDPDLSSYLTEKGLAEPPTPPAAANGATPEKNPTDPAVETRAQELATQTLNRVARQNEERGVVSAFAGRANAIREFMAPFVRGEALPTEMDMERIVSTFNEHHAQSTRVTAMNFLDSLYGEAESLFPGIVQNRSGHNSLKDFLSDLQTRATSSGYVPEREVKKQIASALVERNKHLENNPDVLRAMLSKASAPKPAGSSGMGSTGSLTLAQIDAMPTNQWMAMGDADYRQRTLDAARARAR